MPRNLKNMKIYEVSLVSVPANRRKFFLIKSDLTLDSEGNFLCLNCGNILKQSSVDEENSCIQLKCSECGLELKLKIEKGKEMKTLKEIYKTFIGEDLSEKQVKNTGEFSEDQIKEIEDSLTILNKYREDMPEELLKASGVVIKYATGEYQDIEKAGKKLSKDTIEKIKAAIKALNIESMKDAISALSTLLPEGDKDGVKKGDNENTDSDVDKKLSTLSEMVTSKFTEIVEKMTEIVDKNKKANEGVSSRLDKLEKIEGVKKSLDGDDDDEDDHFDKKWPSLDFGE